MAHHNPVCELMCMQEMEMLKMPLLAPANVLSVF